MNAGNHDNVDTLYLHRLITFAFAGLVYTCHLLCSAMHSISVLPTSLNMKRQTKHHQIKAVQSGADENMLLRPRT
jgi:hypothetical protein